MTANTVTGSRNGARSGALTLILLAAPLNAPILRALAEGRKPLTDMQREVGLPAQSTLRTQLKRLTEIGAVERHRAKHFPGRLEYELTGAGRDLLFVVDAVERWLDIAPNGPLSLDSNAAKSAVTALAEGWSTTMLRVLAAGARSLTELDKVISYLSYPSLERRLLAMRLTGQVEAHPGNGRGTPYGVTSWARRGVAPLAAAGRWERHHLSHITTPVGPIDTETVFLLALPLLDLPAELSGTCRMAVDIRNGDAQRLAGVTVDVQSGKIAACATHLRTDVNAWAVGSPAAWFDALIECNSDRLEIGGDCNLASTTLDALHEKLFVVPKRNAP